MLDPTRFWMYGGNSDDVDWRNEVPCEEIIGPRYPTPYELETRIARVPGSLDPRPSFMDEYVATTGNGAGGLDEFWNLIYKYPRLSGGAIWDWMSPGITEKIRLLRDESPIGNNVSIKGRAVLSEGKFGKAIELNGHDQWVECYQDPLLDVTGGKLTLSFWVYPNRWNGNGTFLVKGDYQFGIMQKDEKTIQFYVTDREKSILEGALPADWEKKWHHIAGICDGEEMTLYINGLKVAHQPFAGKVKNKPVPVSIGYSTEKDGSEYSQHMSNARFDRVSVFDQAIPIDRLLSDDSPSLKNFSRLWLDFESEEVKGEFYSLGIGGRSYGMVWPDRTPQPELWQVKKSAQPVYTELTDVTKGIVEVTNRFAFTNLSGINCRWMLKADNTILEQGILDLAIKAGEKLKVLVPFRKPEIKPGIAYRLILSYETKEDKTWAKSGHELAWEQFDLPWFKSDSIKIKGVPLPLNIVENNEMLTVTGSGFSYIFDKTTGNLSTMKYHGVDLIQKGPVLSVWRAPLVNETDGWATIGSQLKDRQPGMGNGPVNNWYSLGLNNLFFSLELFEWSQNSNGEAIIRVNNHAEGLTYRTAFSNSFTYKICSDGEIEITHTVTPHGVMPAWLPKIGLKWMLNQSFENVKWNGRGPFENYPDRKSGAKQGIYQSRVHQFCEPYLKPQDYGCRSDIKWVTLENGDGVGLTFSGDKLFNFSAQSYDTDHLSRAQYPYQLKPDDAINFNFDYATSGVGCTAISVLNEYRVLPNVYSFVSRIKPHQLQE